MNCDIMLVNLHAFKGRRYFPQQVMATSHALKQKHPWAIKHYYYVSELGDTEAYLRFLKENSPKVIVLMTDTMSISEDCIDVSRMTKKHFPDATVVFGGFMINNFPDCIKDKDVTDYIWFGDAYLCLPPLCEALLGDKKADLPGIYSIDKYFSTPEMEPNYAKNLLDVDLDFDVIEEPDYYILERQGKRAVWGLRTSMGCPFSCFFCYNSTKKSFIRYYDVEKIRDWLVKLKQKWKVDLVLYMDSLFFSNNKRALAIIEMNGELGMSMNNVNMRANDVTDEVCKVFSKHKLDEVFFGSEFYDDIILKKVNKKITVADIDKAVKVAARYPDVTFVTNFIFGVPGTTKKQIRKSLDFMFRTYKHAPNIAVWLCRLYLFPRTPFFKEITERFPEYGDSVDSIIRSGQLFTNDDMPWTELPSYMTTRINVVRHMTAIYMTINRSHWKMTKKTHWWRRIRMHLLQYLYLPTLELRSKLFIWKFFKFEDKLVKFCFGDTILSTHAVKSVKE